MHLGFRWRLLPALLILLSASVARADTLRVVTYNALNLRGGSEDAARMDDFRMIMRAIHPDVAVFQEIITQDAVDDLLGLVFLQFEDDWTALPFHDGPDTDNAILYRMSKVSAASQRMIETSLRDIAEYTLTTSALGAAQPLRIYSAHLKASRGDNNAERRRQEAATLRTQLNQLAPGSLFMMVGDFNLYTSDEPAYQLLLSASPDPDGQLFDPIDSPGNWNDNGIFADIHTQSTDANWGGLDDRFDFQLVSAALMDTAGSYVVPESYRAFGNDGDHFNQSINDGPNGSVPDSVADALFNASDHLPVVMNIVLRPESAPVADRPAQPADSRLLACYPNPFNGTLQVFVNLNGQAGTLEIFDLLGRRMLERPLPAGLATPLALDFTEWGTGSYYVRVGTSARTDVQRVLYLR